MFAIVDASVMPRIVGDNPNAPVITLAEKLADAILGIPPLPPDPLPVTAVERNADRGEMDEDPAV